MKHVYLAFIDRISVYIKQVGYKICHPDEAWIQPSINILKSYLQSEVEFEGPRAALGVTLRQMGP